MNYVLVSLSVLLLLLFLFLLLLLLLPLQEAFDYIQSYTPYLNLNASAAAAYPALLLTASLHDNRVNFWEPAKYTAAMRYIKQQQRQKISSSSSSQPPGTAERPVVFMTDMFAGHFSASAASSRLHERAQKVAFILHNLLPGTVTAAGSAGC